MTCGTSNIEVEESRRLKKKMKVVSSEIDQWGAAELYLTNEVDLGTRRPECYNTF